MKTKFQNVNINAFYCGKKISEVDNRYIYAAVLPNEITIEDDGTKSHNTVVVDVTFYGKHISVNDKKRIISQILITLTKKNIEKSFEPSTVDNSLQLSTYMVGGYSLFYKIKNTNVADVCVTDLYS